MFEDQSIADDVPNRIPISPLGTMAEVASAVVFHALDRADLVTGHHFLMDGDGLPGDPDGSSSRSP